MTFFTSFMDQKEEEPMGELGATPSQREGPWAASQSQELPESGLHGYGNMHICRYVHMACLCFQSVTTFIWNPSAVLWTFHFYSCIGNKDSTLHQNV